MGLKRKSRILAPISGVKNKKLSFILDFSGSTNFQRMVWSETAKIPYGEKTEPTFLSRKRSKVRILPELLVMRLGKNPFPVVIPCHRVLRTDNTMGGFTAAGGVKLKKEMLKLEGFRCKN